MMHVVISVAVGPEANATPALEATQQGVAFAAQPAGALIDLRRPARSTPLPLPTANAAPLHVAIAPFPLR